jgi:hypothetical protein
MIAWSCKAPGQRWCVSYGTLQGQNGERRRQATHPAKTVPELVATAPSQVFTWDITRLAGPAKGIWYHAYVIISPTGVATFKIPDGPPRPSRLAVHQGDVLAIMATDPDRHWHTRELTSTLNTVKEKTLAIHLSAWARKNVLVKTAPATYKLPE